MKNGRLFCVDRRGDEQGAVKQGGPVFGEQDMADIPQRPDEQGNTDIDELAEYLEELKKERK